MPTIILSFIIFQFILQFCGAQLVERNESALRQLSGAVNMQTLQIAAYNLQTTQMPEFSLRTLQKQYGNFYDVQSILTDWQLTSAFFRSFYFYQSAVNRVYANNAVYDLDAFLRLKLPREDAAAFTRLLEGGADKGWLLCDDSLFFVSRAQATSAVVHMLICEVNRDQLSAMIQSSSYYDHHGTYLCDRAGRVLFAMNEGYSLDEGDLQTLIGLEDATGNVELGQDVILYAKSSSSQNDLLYINVIPQGVAYSAIYRLRTIFWLAMLALLALGSIIIAYVMRVNYRPLHELDVHAAASAGLTNATNDAVVNVHNALKLLRDHNSTMVRASAALAKEQLIFKLLLGSYSTPEAFNAEAQDVRLEGDSWRILVLQGKHEGYGDEDFASVLIEQTLGCLPATPKPLYVEIPENRSVVFILSQPVAGADGVELENQLQHALTLQGFTTHIVLSPVQRSLTGLTLAYTKLVNELLLERPEDELSGTYAEQSIDALRNAIEFNEPERICFTLRALGETLATNECPLVILNDVLYTARRSLEDDGDPYALRKLRLATRGAFTGQPMSLFAMRSLLDSLGDLLAECALRNRAMEGERLTNDIMDYLTEHAMDCDFSVQSVADHFRLSLSNLSHYFKNHTGQSASGVVEGLRVQAAKDALLHTDLSVAQIAAQVGYYQPATFMRAFKRATDTTPSDYRLMARAAKDADS